MMMKNRHIILGFIIAFIFVVLTGCGVEHETARAIEIVDEFDNSSPEDEILKEYMMGVGYEYEDTLVLDLSERYGNDVVIYNSEELSPDMIESRDRDEVIVERCYGIVTNDNKDGLVIHPYDEDYGYISYCRCDGVQKGTLMLTYLVYNPKTTYLDDIKERYDCVVSHDMEN